MTSHYARLHQPFDLLRITQTALPALLLMYCFSSYLRGALVANGCHHAPSSSDPETY